MCPSDNKLFRDAGFAMMNEGGGVAYEDAHKVQVHAWMIGGMREFDSFTRERGLTKNCAILAETMRGH
jgi:hypothetical protein